MDGVDQEQRLYVAQKEKRRKRNATNSQVPRRTLINYEPTVRLGIVRWGSRDESAWRGQKGASQAFRRVVVVVLRANGTCPKGSDCRKEKGAELLVDRY